MFEVAREFLVDAIAPAVAVVSTTAISVFVFDAFSFLFLSSEVRLFEKFEDAARFTLFSFAAVMLAQRDMRREQRRYLAEMRRRRRRDVIREHGRYLAEMDRRRACDGRTKNEER